jgi:hypothetical protein
MRRIMLAGAAITAACGLLPGGLAVAEHGCNGEITQIGTGPAAIYVDQRGGGDEVWVYAESNGTGGLQSGGTNALGIADLCGHPDPDQIIF